MTELQKKQPRFVKNLYLNDDLNTFYGTVDSVNGVFADENKNIVTSDGIKIGETKFDAATRYAFIDDDIAIVAGKDSGLTWSTDKGTYTPCTTSDGTDISQIDFKKIQKVNGRYFAIKGYIGWIGNSSDAYQVYVSDDGKTWKKTYSASTTYPTCSLGSIIYNNGYYYAPGDVSHIPEGVESDINILYRSQTAEPGTWQPISIKYTLPVNGQTLGECPLQASQIVAEDDNHIVIAALQKRDADHGYACIRLTIEDDGTLSDVFIKRDAIASTPGNQFFGIINADGQILVGGYGLFKINLIKNGDQVIDITSTKLDAIFPDTKITRDIIFVNGKYYIPTYQGEVYSINSDLTECKKLYTAPEGGKFNSIQFIQDKFYIGGEVTKDSTKYHTIVVLTESDESTQGEILGKFKPLREYLDEISPLGDTNQIGAVAETVDKILNVLKNFKLI